MSRTILITGATGYLGSHLVRALLAAGDQVVILKRKNSSLDRIESRLPDLAVHDLEGLDFSVPFSAHGRIDAVIHAATCYGRRGESAGQVLDANVVFPLRLLEAAIDAGVPLFLNTDTSLDKYLNPYALSKRQFAEWGKYLAGRNRIRFLNARLEHFYGPGDDDSKFATHVIRSCIGNVPELELTAGEQRRDFIYIDDVVSAYLAVLARDGVPDRGFVEFGIGSGEAVSIREFVETVRRMTDSQTRLNFGAVPYRQGEVMFAQADTSLLNGLGWSPNHTLEQGLQLTIAGVNQ